MNGIRILMVEDDEDMLEEMRGAIEAEGWNVDTAKEAKEAMRRVNDNSYDIVLLDLKLPGRDGTSVLKYIKKFYPEIKVFILTGGVLMQKNTFLLADAVMNKPFDVEKVFSEIKELVSRKK